MCWPPRSQPSETSFGWSGTDWRRRFAAAVADDSVASWRGRCREVPCLLIDSLEGVIAAKQKAQEELATVLDYRRDHGLRTVLAADVHVLENRRLSERLRGRMAQGLIVQTAPPGRDVLRSLLRDLADQHQVPLSQEVSETLLRTLGNSVQRTGAVTPNRLRSTLARLKLLAGTSRRDPDAQLVRAATETRTDSTPINIPEIAWVTAKHFGYRLTELKGPSRRRGVTLARACAISLARRLTGATLAEIGRHFGGRDHTTVLHSIKKIESQAQQNAALRITLEDLLRKLQSPLPCS